MHKIFSALLLIPILFGCNSPSDEEVANRLYVAASNAARNMQSETTSHAIKYEKYKQARTNIDEILEDLQSTKTAVALTSNKLEISGFNLDDFITLGANLKKLAEFEQSPFFELIVLLSKSKVNGQFPGAIYKIATFSMKWGVEQQAEDIYNIAYAAGESVKDERRREKQLFDLLLFYALNFTSSLSLERAQTAEKIARKNGAFTHKDESSEYYWEFVPYISQAYFNNGETEKATTLLEDYIHSERTSDSDPADAGWGLFHAARGYGSFNKNRATNIAKESFQLFVNSEVSLVSHYKVVSLIEFLIEIGENETALEMAEAGMEWAREMPARETSLVSVLTGYSKLYAGLGSMDIARKLVSEANNARGNRRSYRRSYDSTILAEAYVKAGEAYRAELVFEAAIKHSQKLDDDISLRVIGVSQASSGFPNEAIETAAIITSDYDKSWVLSWAAAEYAIQGRFVTALKTAMEIKTERPRYLAWRKIIKHYMKNPSAQDFEITALAYQMYESIEKMAREQYR